MWKPASAKVENSAFSNWLSTFKKDSSSEHLDSRLAELSQHSGDLEELIDEASNIIAEHNDDFEFPFESKAASDLPQLLLSTWHLNQHNDGMSAPLRYEVSKPHSILQNDFLQLAAGTSQVPTLQQSLKPISIKLTNSLTKNHHISPLQSGIAIGAP